VPLAWALLGVVYVVWGSTYLGIALAIETMPPLLANGSRFGLAAALMVGLVALTRGPARLRVSGRELGAAAGVGIGLLGVGIGTLALAERYVPSGVAALLIAVIPLWVVLIRSATGDRPGVRTVAGVGIGLAGLAVMLLPGGTEPASGDDRDVLVWSVALLLSSFVWALVSWSAPRLPLPRDPLVMSTYELAAAAVFLTAAGLLRGERLDPSAYSARSWAGWLYLAVIGSLAAYTAYVWLLDNVPLSLVSTYAYVNPVVAVLLGALVLAEPMTPDVVVGMTVVLGGVVLVVSGERRRRDPRGPATEVLEAER
jgi:drug/metabolite transporter (DMT)-like permease